MINGVPLTLEPVDQSNFQFGRCHEVITYKNFVDRSKILSRIKRQGYNTEVKKTYDFVQPAAKNNLMFSDTCPYLLINWRPTMHLYTFGYFQLKSVYMDVYYVQADVRELWLYKDIIELHELWYQPDYLKYFWLSQATVNVDLVGGSLYRPWKPVDGRGRSSSRPGFLNWDTIKGDVSLYQLVGPKTHKQKPSPTHRRIELTL